MYALCAAVVGVCVCVGRSWSVARRYRLLSGITIIDGREILHCLTTQKPHEMLKDGRF